MKGDFIGFSFDGIHCSQLGITHVSSSDRYSEELFPEVKDKTIEIPNNHGEYYYGSTYGTRTFTIDFAYDSITETQFRNIRRLFGTTKICELIFDERPYKVYFAKVESPIEMSYVCFDEPKKIIIGKEEGNELYGVRVANRTIVSNTEQVEDEETGEISEVTTYTTEIERERIYPYKRIEGTERIYKGEGTINLVCYSPFAHQQFKILELYAQEGNLVTSYNNINEWAASSGILSQAEWNTYNIDKVLSAGAPYTYAIPVYNPGDLNVGFGLYIPFVNGEILPKDGNSVIIINGDTEVLVLNKIKQKGQDTGIFINTVNHLIEGVNFSLIANLNDYRKVAKYTTGNLYNEYIVMGEFPYIKRNDWRFDNLQYPQAIYISCKDYNVDNQENFDSGIRIYYDYLYF